jgi:ketosteroid isomerase-like protein
MRRAFLTLIFAASTSLPLIAQQPEAITALAAQQASWNRGDLQAYTSFYKDAPDTMALLSMPVRGLQSIRNQYAINFPNQDSMGTLEESEIHVRELGDRFTLVTGVYHLTRVKKSGGEAEGSFTDIFEKTSQGWKIIYSSTT